MNTGQFPRGESPEPFSDPVFRTGGRRGGVADGELQHAGVLPFRPQQRPVAPVTDDGFEVLGALFQTVFRQKKAYVFEVFSFKFYLHGVFSLLPERYFNA